MLSYFSFLVLVFNHCHGQKIRIRNSVIQTLAWGVRDFV